MKKRGEGISQGIPPSPPGKASCFFPLKRHLYFFYSFRGVDGTCNTVVSSLVFDARCDSPGVSAKDCIYSFQDDFTKEIVHFEMVQVTEASSSVAMELVGFQREYLLERGDQFAKY
ncbi:unnamed protein product [Arctogadus glacialis]